MKNLNILIAILITSSTNAQFGNLLNKAKEKLTEKKIEKKAEINSKTNAMTTEDLETFFEFPYQGIDYKSPITESLAEILKEDAQSYSPFRHIRKKGETETMHFVKDYAELQPVSKTINDNTLKIEFYEVLPNSGIETFRNSFSSKNHIYLKITTKIAIKDVFKLDEDKAEIQLRISIYDDVKQKITNSNGNVYINLSKAQANLKSLDIDILPHTMKNTAYGNDEFYFSPFPNMHNQNTFTQNGKYKVAVFIFAPEKDDWGKTKSGDGIIYGNSFEYDFAAKDTEAIKSDQSAVYELLKNGIKFAKKELPKQWMLKSNAFTMGLTEQQIANLYVNSYSGGAKILKVVKVYAHQSGGGWTIQKNDLGIPEYRYSNQYYTLFVKNTETSECYFQDFSLRQEYNGGGTYAAIRGDITYDTTFTDCSKMK